jgi:hypothetical protein
MRDIDHVYVYMYLRFFRLNFGTVLSYRVDFLFFIFCFSFFKSSNNKEVIVVEGFDLLYIVFLTLYLYMDYFSLLDNVF